MWKNKTVYTVIPARGGSKGIPKKNTYPLNGMPLISYTVKASLGCEYVDKTWVSSDDDDILSISKLYGAETVKRPKDLATDTSSSEEALLHFAHCYDFDILVFMQATAPLSISSDITNSIEMLDKYDSIVTVSLYRPPNLQTRER